MRVTKRQLRRIIREALSRHRRRLAEGYMVPDFPNTDSMFMFIEELDPDDEVEDDVVDPETGELMIPAGETSREQEWFEEVAEEVAEEVEAAPEPDDYEYDWAAYDAELEAKEEKKRADDERIQAMLIDAATAGGEDWAADTLHDAENNPHMWRVGHASPEEYVMTYGQDAAGDIADSLLQYSSEPEVATWFNSLPDKEDEFAVGWGASRPTKTIMREILADYFYDGVSRALEKKRVAQ